MRRYIVGVRLFGVLLLAAGSLYAQAVRAGVNEGFDKPLSQTVLDFGRSPMYMPSRKVRNKLTCFYYTDFTVKEYDQGEKGAEWISIVLSPSAACTRTHGQDEKIYDWGGYFWGVTGPFVFLVAADGEDGGTPFAAFDPKTGQKLYEDSFLLDYYQKILPIKNVFRVNIGGDQNPRLTYFRVVRAGCDLHAEPADCWNKARTELGITQTEIPVCREYDKPEENWGSAVVYPVSVVLTDSPKIKPIDGPVFCWPTD